MLPLPLLILLGFFATGATAQPVVIQPGRAIGPIELGMPLDRARAVMDGFGTVEDVDSATAHGFCNPDRGVGVCVFDRWQVLGITVVFLLSL
mgnify:CR=1 FL=1